MKETFPLSPATSLKYMEAWNALMNESKTRLTTAVCCRQKKKIDDLELIVENGSMSKDTL